jgi:hypothetical protein
MLSVSRGICKHFEQYQKNSSTDQRMPDRIDRQGRPPMTKRPLGRFIID